MVRETERNKERVRKTRRKPLGILFAVSISSRSQINRRAVIRLHSGEMSLGEELGPL